MSGSLFLCRMLQKKLQFMFPGDVFFPPVPSWDKAPSIPSDLTPHCILKHWDKFDTQTLKKKCLIFLCNTVWPLYKLPDQESSWSLGRTKAPNTILQHDLFCRSSSKWSEILNVQVFVTQNPTLHQTCRMCMTGFSGPTDSSHILIILLLLSIILHTRLDHLKSHLLPLTSHLHVNYTDSICSFSLTFPLTLGCYFLLPPSYQGHFSPSHKSQGPPRIPFQAQKKFCHSRRWQMGI